MVLIVTPVCLFLLLTGVVIKTIDNVPLPRRDGMYYYDLKKGSAGVELVCVLEGFEEEEIYTASWTLPRKANGEVPPSVTANGRSLIFQAAFPEQNGSYECSIAGLTDTVTVQFNQTAGKF